MSAYLVLAAPGPAISSPNCQGTICSPLRNTRFIFAVRLLWSTVLQRSLYQQAALGRDLPPRGAPPASARPPARSQGRLRANCSLEVHPLRAGQAGTPQRWEEYAVTPDLFAKCQDTSLVTLLTPTPNLASAAAAKRPSQLTISRPKWWDCKFC